MSHRYLSLPWLVELLAGEAEVPFATRHLTCAGVGRGSGRRAAQYIDDTLRLGARI